MDLEKIIRKIEESSSRFLHQVMYDVAKLGVIAALALAPVSCTPSPPIKPDVSSYEIAKANQLANKFPKTLPRARVRRFIEPGAKYCLIHIRDRHLDSDLSNLQDFKAVQEDIYQTLFFLNKEYGVKEVYLEGVSEENKSFIDSITNRLKNKEQLHKKYTMNATFQLASQGKITIFPGEDAKIVNYLLTQKYVNQANDLSSPRKIKESYLKAPPFVWERNFYTTLDARENALLSIVTNKKPYAPLAVTVFGQTHSWIHLEKPDKQIDFDYKGKRVLSVKSFFDGENWRHSVEDNVRSWNKKYPNEKFSFIEITPNSLQNGKTPK